MKKVIQKILGLALFICVAGYFSSVLIGLDQVVESREQALAATDTILMKLDKRLTDIAKSDTLTNHEKDSMFLCVKSRKSEYVESRKLPYATINYGRVPSALPEIGIFLYAQKHNGPTWNIDVTDRVFVPYDYVRGQVVAKENSDSLSGSPMFNIMFAGNGFVINGDTFTARHIIQKEEIPTKRNKSQNHWSVYGSDIASSSPTVVLKSPRVKEIVSVTGVAVDNKQESSSPYWYTISATAVVLQVVYDGRLGTFVVMRRDTKRYNGDTLGGISGSCAVVTTANGKRYFAIASQGRDQYETLMYEIVTELHEQFWWEKQTIIAFQ